jgi:methylenetetrahydrofolate dehydrogenase (NADP+) / methenyltetrahydrofolate cyclohydrolase
MPAILLDGKKLAAEIRGRIKNEIAAKKITPELGVILVGTDPASHLYVALKEKAALEVGIKVIRYDLPSDVPESDIVNRISEWNADKNINGILVQLPLPEHLDPDAVIGKIDPAKDVDGFHPKNTTGIISPGIGGCLALIDKTGVDISGKHAVVVGNSSVFSQTFVDALRHKHAIAEPAFPENFELIKKADILVVAVGRPGWIKTENVKPGAIVIDVGTNKVDGKTVGDIAPDVANVASYITPVPGGVGPVTVAKLLENCLALYEQQNR